MVHSHVVQQSPRFPEIGDCVKIDKSNVGLLREVAGYLDHNAPDSHFDDMVFEPGKKTTNKGRPVVSGTPMKSFAVQELDPRVFYILKMLVDHHNGTPAASAAQDCAEKSEEMEGSAADETSRSVPTFGPDFFAGNISPVRLALAFVRQVKAYQNRPGLLLVARAFRLIETEYLRGRYLTKGKKLVRTSGYEFDVDHASKRLYDPLNFVPTKLQNSAGKKKKKASSKKEKAPAPAKKRSSKDADKDNEDMEGEAVGEAKKRRKKMT